MVKTEFPKDWLKLPCPHSKITFRIYLLMQVFGCGMKRHPLGVANCTQAGSQLMSPVLNTINGPTNKQEKGNSP